MKVEFDPAEFKAGRPELQSVPNHILRGYFETAGLILANNAKSPVKDLEERKRLLYLLACHIAELEKRGGGQVGALASATEGKVSVSFSAATQNPTWYNQTQSGWLFWLAMAKYRLGGFYVPYERSH